MQISVRSYLTAGTVAAVGAGAIVLAPPMPLAPVVPAQAPVVAEVSLAALSLNFDDVLGFLQGLGLGTGIPSDVIDLVPSTFVDAVVGEFVNQAGELVTTAGSNILAYFSTALGGLIAGPDSIPGRFGDALANIPTVLSTAFQSLSTGDIPTALQTLATGLVAPLTSVGQAIADAGKALQDYITAQVNGVVGGLPGVLLNAITVVVGGNLQSVIDQVTSALSGLLGGIFPAAAVPAAAVVALPLARSTAVTARPALAAASAVKVSPRAAAVQAEETVQVNDVVAEQDPAVQAEAAPAAPVRRPHAVAPRPVLADAVAAEVTAQPKPTQRPRPVAKSAASRAGGMERVAATG